MSWNGFFWLRMWESCGLFWMRWWTSWLHKMWGIYWKSEELSASQEAICCLSLVTWLGRWCWQTDRQLLWCGVPELYAFLIQFRSPPSYRFTVRHDYNFHFLSFCLSSDNGYPVESIVCDGNHNIGRLYLDPRSVILYRSRKESFIIME